MARDTDLAYFAGVFDGEGYIGGHAASPKFAPTLRVVMANTYLPIVEDFQKTFGGKIVKPDKRNNWKTAWRWQVHGKEAEKFLLDVLPFLRIKKVQAELGLRLVSLQGKSGQSQGQEIRDLRYSLSNQMKLEKKIEYLERGI